MQIVSGWGRLDELVSIWQGFTVVSMSYSLIAQYAWTQLAEMTGQMDPNNSSSIRESECSVSHVSDMRNKPQIPFRVMLATIAGARRSFSLSDCPLTLISPVVLLSKPVKRSKFLSLTILDISPDSPENFLFQNRSF